MPHSPSQQEQPPNPGLYSTFNLRVLYPLVVTRGSHRPVWRVSNRELAALYERRTGAGHVEIGPGNGHFLHRLRPPSRPERLVLIDVHPGPLDVTARRLAGRIGSVHRHRGDALEAWPEQARGADSAAATMMLHTLPGPGYAAKARLFDRAAEVLRPGGVFFGATILDSGEGVRHTRLSRALMSRYRARGWFDNASDTREDLERELAERFELQTFDVRGCVALWAGVRRG